MVFPNIDANNTYHFFTYANSVTDGSAGTILTWTIFFTVFLMILRDDTRKAYAAASFLSFVSSLIFYLLGICTEWLVGLTILMSAFAIVILYVSER
jgi:hypothetical protein